MRPFLSDSIIPSFDSRRQISVLIGDKSASIFKVIHLTACLADDNIILGTES